LILEQKYNQEAEERVEQSPTEQTVHGVPMTVRYMTTVSVIQTAMYEYSENRSVCIIHDERGRKDEADPGGRNTLTH